MISNAGSTPIWVATQTTAEKAVVFFSAPARIESGRKFHYNMTPAICQVKNAKKINKLFFPKPLDKLRLVCYNVDTNKRKR